LWKVEFKTLNFVFSPEEAFATFSLTFATQPRKHLIFEKNNFFEEKEAARHILGQYATKFLTKLL
jgi:hypothetical protein